MSDPSDRKFSCRLWRVNIDGRIVEGRWRHAIGAINGAACKLFGSGLIAPEHDYADLVIHVECIGQPEPRPDVVELEPSPPPCPHCVAGEPSVFDGELEWFAHPDGDKLKMCHEPWRPRQTQTAIEASL